MTNYSICPKCGNQAHFQINTAVFEELKRFRYEKAKSEKLPPYCIFHNTTLSELSSLLPDSEFELLKIKGMGVNRIEKYGKDILDIIQDNKKKEPYVTPKIFDNETKSENKIRNDIRGDNGILKNQIIKKLKHWRKTLEDAEDLNELSEKSQEFKRFNRGWGCISDAMIIEIAEKLPKSLDELFKIHGMGETKIEKYGLEIIEIVNNYQEFDVLNTADYLDHFDQVKSIREYTPINVFRKLKTKYPEHLIFIQSGYFYEVFGNDAEDCHRIFGWKTIHRSGCQWTGVPKSAYNFKRTLRNMNKPFLIVDQAIEDGELRRKISEEVM